MPDLYISFMLMSDKKLHRIVSEFFRKRFKRDPKVDRAYYMEWFGRFRTGQPERYMDLESQRVFKKVMEKKLKKLM